MNKIAKLFSAAVLCLFFVDLHAAEDHPVQLSLNKPDGLYRKSDTIILTIKRRRDGNFVNLPARLTVIYTNGRQEKIFFAQTPVSYRIAAGKASPHIQFVVEALLAPDKAQTVTIKGKTLPVKRSIGAVVDAHLLRPGFEEPSDFEKFWLKAKAELSKIPLKELERKEVPISDKMLKNARAYFALRLPHVMKRPTKLEGRFKCYDVKISAPGAPVSGCLVIPAGARNKSLPALVSFHGASGTTANPAFLDHAIRLDVNSHGFENFQPQEYYQNLFRTTHRQFYYQNSGNRDKFYFKNMFLRVQRALDYVKSLKEYDGKTLIVAGNSMGGAQALAAAGLDKDVKLIYAAVPALCDHGGILSGRRSGWPEIIKQKNGRIINQDAVKTAPYFDAAFFAKRIRAEAYLTVGLMDTTCIPTSVFAAYNNIPGKKHITILPQHKHSGTYSLEFNKRVQEVIAAAAGCQR